MKTVIASLTILVTTNAAHADTYRLIHALGNAEKEIARGLKKDECEAMKRDRKRISNALGIHNETLGLGSITCLPESIFAD
ncbi:hypothetical protein [Nitratireductor sp. GZWM139]|uniref:hypothetical protein n=1 Tax=Nitratireductor sp. GZWM139 TaxID=2950541 RepID=UPI0024BEF321|nr:hypothetical protein [Nitratireductor sp. GZWM139]MDJ1463329.1 hypothetical protein [Nitratireductor sp. GZWM139]